MLKNLTLLHSNDMHGDFLAEEIDEKLVGGVSLLSGYVNHVRETEENTLYCVAGDMFRGSVIDSEFKGLSTIEIMNTLSPDVVTIGNHEVDYGITHLLFIEKCAKFPIINANLHIKTNRARLFKPFRIIEIDGMKILFIGITTEDILASTKREGYVGTFVDIGEAAEEVGRICNAYNATDIDLTVLLTHIGHEEDKKLAAQLNKDWGVDIIIGGHSHTFLEEPAIVNDIVVQAGIGTDQIGRFDLVIDTDKNCIDSFSWKTIPIDAQHCQPDEAMENLIHHFKDQTDMKYGRVVTRLARKLTHPNRSQETELGNLVADIMTEMLNIDVMMFGSGSIRKKQWGPVVTYQDFIECFPYDDAIHMIKVTGKQFREMVRFMLRDEAFEGDHTEFYQFPNSVHLVYDLKKKDFESFQLHGQPLQDDQIVTVGLADYHFKNLKSVLNIDLEEVEANGKPTVLTTSVNQVLEEYLSANNMADAELDSRIVIK